MDPFYTYQNEANVGAPESHLKQKPELSGHGQIPERWTYERRYTIVRDITRAINTAMITFAIHSGVLPGFLHTNTTS